MTVSTTTTYNEATGAAGWRPFYFTFVCHEASWVKVYLDDVIQGSRLLDDPVRRPGREPGGYVTFTDAPDGKTVRLERQTALTQETNYAAYDAFPAEAHELALDKAVLIAQDEARDAGLDAVEAEAAMRAAADQAIIAAGVPVALAGSAFVTATDRTEARTLADRFAETVNPMDFGAVGDGDRSTTASRCKPRWTTASPSRPRRRWSSRTSTTWPRR